MTAAQIAASVARGDTTAAAVVESTLTRIAQRNAGVNAFTAVTAERARAEAAAVDARRAAGLPLPPLAGVPYAVKNLFDVTGLPTLAGSKLHERHPAAATDAELVRRMAAAGAVLVGALNMDAYAYGFTTENTGYGPCRNPHDPSRTCGGSSGGCGAAVAGGLVPLTLGSDTNGSIRVPSSLCGVFGLKPTYGRLSRTGSYPFVHSLDHLGPFATTVDDLARCYDALQGPDPRDPACCSPDAVPVTPSLEQGVDGLRIARLGGYFDTFASPQARAAAEAVAAALGATAAIELPEVERARAAAFMISAAEGGTLHLETLKRDYDGFEPHNRDRLLAGALGPGTWYVKAQRFRAWFAARMQEVFERYDVLLAPATPVPATVLGDEWFDLGGRRLPLRASMGLFTQPISFVGLPVVAVPVETGDPLPIGVQVIAAPWREDLALRVAAHLERIGAVRARVVP